MYCSKCGAEIDDNSEYCSKCGAKIESNQQNYSRNEEKLKKYLLLILIILPLPLIFFYIFSENVLLDWKIQLIIQASLSVIGVYCLYTNKKLYGRISILIAIFLGLLLVRIQFYSIYLPMLEWVILAYVIALILDYYWSK